MVAVRSGSSGDWVRVDAGDRSGYARSRDVAIVR